MKPAILFLLLTVALFSACKKEETTPVVNDYISFKADGVLKTGTYCQAAYFKSNTNNYSRISILARTSNNERMGLDVTRPVIGQNTDSNVNGLYTIPMGVDSTHYMIAAEQEIIIKSLTNERVTGTFKFKGTNYLAPTTDTKTITEGSFGCKVMVR